METSLQFSHLLDASREDGSLVMLKRIDLSRHPDEVEIGRLFSSESFASNPKNCCVPFYDVLRIPDDDDSVIIVMPLLYPIGHPSFQTIGEVVDFFRQIFEVASGPSFIFVRFMSFYRGYNLCTNNTLPIGIVTPNSQVICTS
jgi:hypothetical protein